MAEIPEEQNSEQFDAQHLFDLVRRRHMHFLIPLLAAWCAVWGASWILPPRYKSNTLILVEQPTMPKNYVLPNINDDLQARLQSITQQILSRTRLLTIIDKMNLYGGKSSGATEDQKVAMMRKDIDIELVHDQHNEEITAFKINYSAHDPHLAQQVTTALTDLFITENLKVREAQSEGTTKFIEDQLEEARTTLSEQEAKVRAFEAQHEGILPSQQASNLQILSGLQAQLQNEQDALNTAKQQRVYLQALIEQNKTLHGTSRTGEAGSADLPSIDSQLSKMQEELLSLSTRYTDQYPDVLALKEQIAKTEKLRDNLIAEAKARASDPKLAAKSATDGAQSGPLMQLQGQLQANQLEIANRERAISELMGRINEYQGRLNEEPEVEQQVADLTRGYDQSKANYDDLLKKENESSMATSMEQMQQGERFTMLDPPSLPVNPDFPNRLTFCGIGLGIGIAFGAVVVAGFEFLDDRLYREKEITALLPIAVISEIPMIPNSFDEEASNRKRTLGWAMAALTIVTILAGSAFSAIHG
jgi:polysaccharide chain length determinant protein (PEP-CTERM system associated)